MTPDPDLDAITSTFLGADADFVVIGGFAVIAHRYVRATEDVDLLVPVGEQNDLRCHSALEALGGVRAFDGAELSPAMLVGRPHLRVLTGSGLVDLLREGEPPLDFESAASGALKADLGAGEFKIAGLETLVALKRLSDRPRDRNDLAELEAEHGDLPIAPIPGLDD